MKPLRWSAIGALAGHVAELADGRVRCSCAWSTRATAFAPARAAHARHVELVALLGAAGGAR